MKEQTNEKTTQIAEMVLGIMSADGKLSRTELIALRDMAPQYLHLLNTELFDRYLDGFDGVPSFSLASRKLNDLLSSEEKNDYYSFLKAIAESDELDPKEVNLLNELKQTWDLK